MSGFEVSSF